MAKYSKEDLLKVLADFEEANGKLPTQNQLRAVGISEDPFHRLFGGFKAAKKAYRDEGFTKEVLTESMVGDKLGVSKQLLLDELSKALSMQELATIVQATKLHVSPAAPIELDAIEGSFKVLVTGDSHIGHAKFCEEEWHRMIEHAKEENVDWMWHVGDIVEGMSGRPGHVYELEHVGFEAQFGKCVELFEHIPFQIRAVTGNHDLWGHSKGDAGVDIGRRLAERLPEKFVYLGPQEADELINGIKVKLWHGNDGSAYSLSYRCQKFVENLTGGEKPHILLAGHTHKAIYFQTRNVSVLECGTMCAQTSFMRGKKLAAHTGYWILEVHYNRTGIVKILPEWNPFFAEGI